jgi:tRNA-uridine 2-sulfurtransferase
MVVAVGLSGGVDSAVAALLLKQQGHAVIGVMMRLWDGESSAIAGRGACYGPAEEGDIDDARAICSVLDIPLHVLDCSKKYRDIVLSYFAREYGSGRTPNPCVKCNHEIKFGVLPEVLRASGVGFDRFATGHYAAVLRDAASGRYYLRRAADRAKDQTYFLYRLSQQQLSSVLFPLGSFTKSQVREIARSNFLPVSDKTESQDFYEGSYGDLVKTESCPGIIRHIDDSVAGTHQGIWNYTIGQRKGLGVTGSQPLYVTSIDAQRNEVRIGPKSALYAIGLVAQDYAGHPITAPRACTAKLRSSSPEAACTVSFEGNRITVMFGGPQHSVTPGQSVVFYHDDKVIGGAIIEAPLKNA